MVHGEDEHFYFCFVNAEFYRVVWTINALLIIRSEMLPISENNQNIKMFGVPPNIIHNNYRKIWWCFLMIPCTFWRSRKKKLNSPKLSCGFNWTDGYILKILNFHCLSTFCSTFSVLCLDVDKVHWASKETYHFFRVTFTEIHCIKIIHIWTQIG